MDILDILLIVWQVYATASAIAVTWFLIRLYTEVKGIKRIMAEANKPRVKFVYVEKHNNLVYLYDALTKTFIAQADTEESLFDQAQQRFPNFKLIQADMSLLDKSSI